jgi:drug/metabolite transporter (DMT)-like permease
MTPLSPTAYRYFTWRFLDRFGSYLTLVGRIGADKAAYAALLFPVIALGLSTLFEDYQWTLRALFGFALVLLGNYIVLSRSRNRR